MRTIRKTLKVMCWSAAFLFLALQPFSANAQLTFEFAAVAKYTYTDTASKVGVIQYYDGFGRPFQTVRHGAGGNGRNIVDVQQYDVHGNVCLKSIPVPFSGDEGYTYYRYLLSVQEESDSGPVTYRTYSNLQYDSSPTPRILCEGGEGIRGITRYRYLSNNQSDISCVRYVVGSDGVNMMGLYSPGELMVTEVTDEDGNISYEFKDKLDRVILERNVSGNERYDTYYVYDSKDNLRYVLPPKLSESAVAYLDSSDAIRNIGYVYRYDNHNRCIYKKLPGAEPIYYIYDDADRVIFKQDGNQRQKGEWSFSIPDVFGRPVLEGLCTNSFNNYASALNGKVVNAVADYDGVISLAGYSVNEVSLDSARVLVANYYDDYAFLELDEFADSGLEYANDFPSEYRTRWTDGGSPCHSKNLLTGSLVAVLDEDDSIEGYRKTACYYDYRQRPVVSYEEMPDGGRNRYARAYDYLGNLISEWGVTYNTQYGAIYEYDSYGRLLSERPQLNGTFPCQINHSYDSYGRLATTSFAANDTLRTIRYSYAVNGWQTKLDSDWIDMELHYNDVGLPGSVPTHGGKVSEVEWSRPDDDISYGYSFLYDSLSRVRDSRLFTDGQLDARFSERSISYDSNGNVLEMLRSGAGVVADTLSYSYVGNQLSGCTYDANGNLTYDPKTGLSFEWNHLNLPRKVSRGDTVLVNYSYLADGTKFSAFDDEGRGLEYHGSLTFRKNGTSRQVESREFSCGRIYLMLGTPTPFVPFYHVKDYLGSVRAVVDGRSGEVVEANDYYAFGSRWETSSSSGTISNRYRFNGKEDQEGEFGVPTLDYGARHYTPSSARWLSMDPLAEKYYGVSPYAFCNNDPMNFVDLDGEAIDLIIDVISIGCGIYNLTKNIIAGNASEAWSDAAGIGADLVCAIIPGLTVGAGVGKTVAKATLNVIDTGVDASKTTSVATSVKNSIEGVYSNVSNPRNAGPGKNFTKKQKQEILQANRDANGGILRSDGDGRVLNPPQKSLKGQKADMNQAEVDHIEPKSKGGTNNTNNAQVLSKEENLRKSDKWYE